MKVIHIIQMLSYRIWMKFYQINLKVGLNLRSSIARHDKKERVVNNSQSLRTGRVECFFENGNF